MQEINDTSRYTESPRLAEVRKLIKSSAIRTEVSSAAKTVHCSPGFIGTRECCANQRSIEGHTSR